MTSAAPESVDFPTEWHVTDLNTGSSPIESRQLDTDIYQLRSPTHILTINAEGFNLFRKFSFPEWNKYLKDNDIHSVPREAADD